MVPCSAIEMDEANGWRAMRGSAQLAKHGQDVPSLGALGVPLSAGHRGVPRLRGTWAARMDRVPAKYRPLPVLDYSRQACQDCQGRQAIPLALSVVSGPLRES